MATTPKSKESVASDNPYDDLTAIKGIKQARQQWFRDIFKVRTFHDLASLSVDEIEAKLKAEKQIPSRSKIEMWVAEAKRLAEHPGLATATKANLHSSEDTWKPVASFVVEIQEQEGMSQVEWRTRVHHIESDQTRTWPGVEQQNLCQWMMQQWGEKALPPFARVAPSLQHSAVATPAAPSAPPAQTPLTTQTGFSQNLQQILAKAARASRLTAPSVPTNVPIMSTSQSTPPTSLTVSSPNETDKPRGGYSPRMQEILAKAQRLSSKKP